MTKPIVSELITIQLIIKTPRFYFNYTKERTLKMNELTQETPLTILKETLTKQNDQGQALLLIVERMEKQEERVDKKISTVENLVEEVSKRVHLEEEEATQIKKLVNRKAWKFAKRYFNEKQMEPSSNLFLSKTGQFRGNLYRRLKTEFNVTKYTSIKHVDFNAALTFIEGVVYESMTAKELRMTPKQLELLALEKGMAVWQ